MYIEITPTNNIVTFRYQTTPDYDSEVIDFTQLKQDLVVTLKYENGAWIASHNYNQIATAIAEGVLVRLTDETNSRYAIMGEYGDDFYSFVTNDGETCYFYKVTDADMWSLSTSPAINVADNLTTSDPDKALSAKQGVVLKGMLDQITIGDTDNLADMYAALNGKAGLTYDGNGAFYGIAGTGGFRGNEIDVTCEEGQQYTLSFKAYTDGNSSTSGNGLRLEIHYTDATSSAVNCPNSTSAYTLFSKTSTAGKTIDYISFNYVSTANNVWYVKELQLRKGTEVLPYLPPKSVVDFMARAGLETKEDVANKATTLSPVPNNTRYPSEKMMYDSAIVPFRDITMPKSSNIYDYATVGVINGYIVRTTGAIGTNEEYAAFTTGLIPVKPNTFYYLSNNYGTKGIRCLKADSTTKLKVLAPSNGAEYSDWYLPNADATDSVQNGQFKTPADAAYVQITVTPLYVTEIGDYYKIMLEEVGDAYDPSFVPSEYAPYSTERVVRNDCLEIPVEGGGTPQKELKILCFGNSFTLDSMAYAPFLLKDIAEHCKLTIGVAYISGSPLAQHLAYLSGESVVQGTTTYYTEGGVYKKDANGTISTVTYTYYKNVNGAPWTTQNNAQIDDFINDEAWDIVTFQQASAQSYKEWATYFEPYIYKIHESLANVLDNPNFRIGWLLTHGASGGSDQGYYDRWLGTARNAQRVMDKTGASVLFPYGTAVQNLRTTSLISLGDGEHHNLTVDDAHLQDGIGCLCAAYANTLVLLQLFGEDTKGVIGNTIRPDAAWLTANSVPGTSLGQSGVIGITDANCFLAQMAAIKGVMAPYEVTDINVYEAISAAYVTFDIAGYTLSGVAGTTTDPGAPAGKVFWLAFDAGTYANFGSTVIAAGQVGIFSYDGSSWTYTVKTIADLSDYATLNQLNAKYTKPEAGIPASDLAEGVIPAPEIFWATYGTTTAAEIDAAVAAGKAVMCYYNSRVYYLALYSPTAATLYFGSTFSANGGYASLSRSTNSWAYDNPSLERASQKISDLATLITNRASTTKYPSAKATFDGLGQYGIVSQTQTWSGTGSQPRTYVMSDLQYGLIPQANIDLFTSAGATFNATTGYFELGQLTDISYEEMQMIYSCGIMSVFCGIAYAYFGDLRNRANGKYVRSTLPIKRMGASQNLSYQFNNSYFEQVIFDIPAGIIGFQSVNSCGSAFNHTERLKHIDLLKWSGTAAQTVTNAYSLQDFTIMNLSVNLSIKDSSALTLASVVYIVDNAANTSAITITLHATAYARCQADTTEYIYGGNTYTGILAYASARNITIASA